MDGLSIGAQEASGDTKIARKSGKAAGKAGDALVINWQKGSGRYLNNRPVHIVLTMPEWVRFEGAHILPIPPGGRAPSDIHPPLRLAAH